MCNKCESSTRNIWGPSISDLDLETIDSGNWINLDRCNECSTFWVYTSYEPYSSFPYWVKWKFPATYWRIVHDFDEGNSLHEWMKLQIKSLWSGLPENDKFAIEFHRKRSYNYYNPIDSPVEKEVNIEEIITAHNTGFCKDGG